MLRIVQQEQFLKRSDQGVAASGAERFENVDGVPQNGLRLLKVGLFFAAFALRTIDRTALRKRARPSLDLPRAISAYLSIYADPGTAVSVGPW